MSSVERELLLKPKPKPCCYRVRGVGMELSIEMALPVKVEQCCIGSCVAVCIVILNEIECMVACSRD